MFWTHIHQDPLRLDGPCRNSVSTLLPRSKTAEKANAGKQLTKAEKPARGAEPSSGVQTPEVLGPLVGASELDPSFQQFGRPFKGPRRGVFVLKRSGKRRWPAHRPLRGPLFPRCCLRGSNPGAQAVDKPHHTGAEQDMNANGYHLKKTSFGFLFYDLLTCASAQLFPNSRKVPPRRTRRQMKDRSLGVVSVVASGSQCVVLCGLCDGSVLFLSVFACLHACMLLAKSSRQSHDSTVAACRVQSVTVPSSRVSRECRSPGLRSPPFRNARLWLSELSSSLRDSRRLCEATGMQNIDLANHRFRNARGGCPQIGSKCLQDWGNIRKTNGTIYTRPPVHSVKIVVE